MATEKVKTSQETGFPLFKKVICVRKFKILHDDFPVSPHPLYSYQGFELSTKDPLFTSITTRKAKE